MVAGGVLCVMDYEVEGLTYSGFTRMYSVWMGRMLARQGKTQVDPRRRHGNRSRLLVMIQG